MPETTLDDAPDLARFAYGGYYSAGSTGPISMVEGRIDRGDGPEAVTLVGLSDLDVARVRDSDQAVGVRESVIVGLGSSDNAYFEAAKAAIQENVEPGSMIVLAGHSLGGMVAQQLADDRDLKDQYDIVSTVTFGSPLLRPGQREGDVRRLGDAGDPVPQLRLEGFLVPWWRDFGLHREFSRYSTRGILAAHNESYLDPEVWGRYDALGVRGGTSTVTYDPEAVCSFEAPRMPQTLERRSDVTTPEPEVREALLRSVPEITTRLAEAGPDERQELLQQAREVLAAVALPTEATPGDGAATETPEVRAVHLASVEPQGLGRDV